MALRVAWSGLEKLKKTKNSESSRDHDPDAVLKHRWMKEHLFDGYRYILESILQENWEARISLDFQQITEETAKWSIQGVEGVLMPVLQDSNNVYFLGPTSVQNVFLGSKNFLFALHHFKIGIQ